MALPKPPSWNQIRDNARTFAARWADVTDENAEAQSFWTEFLQIFGIDRRRVATFEARARRRDGRGRIDLLWPGTLVVEHKSRGKNLLEAQEQAYEYLEALDDRDLPELLVLSDFGRFRIVNLRDDDEPYEFAIENLAEEIERFAVIAGYRPRRLNREDQREADIAAAELMGSLYDQLVDAGFDDHAVSRYLVRILLLFFGDDTGLWERGLFEEFIETRTQADGSDLGPQMAMLFQVLATPEGHRSADLDELLARFPYVNGRIFDEVLAIPALNTTVRGTILRCSAVDWGQVAPEIFGSLFQSIRDRDARRALGEHYTSEANILKVIRSLFLDELDAEFRRHRHNAPRLAQLRDSLAQFKFLDPACGCGNFLVVAYRELRRLELDIMKALRDLTGNDQLALDATLGLRVSPGRFYGIECEEWPAQIAETAMFLVDHQVNQETARIFGQAPDRLPITTAATIVHGNALRLSWEEVVPGMDDKTFIMGNPPFVGSLNLSEEQRDDARMVWGGNRRRGTLDYVTNWLVLAARCISRTGCRAAFVATNSIAQGEQVAPLWDELGRSNVRLCFAHQPFKWQNEAGGQAAVHVVILGLAAADAARPRAAIFSYEDLAGDPRREEVDAINPYLLPGDTRPVRTRGEPLSPGQGQMLFGSMARDDGLLSNISGDEAARIRRDDPIAGRYLRRLIGARELLYDEERWCLWLVAAEPEELRQSPVLRERLDRVRRFRLASTAAPTRTWADQPALFVQRAQPDIDYLAVPGVSSEERDYVPMAIMPPDVIASNALLIVPGADQMTFGLLMSSPFNVWARLVSGRLESRLRLSAEITYHNFPFPDCDDEARRRIHEAVAQMSECRSAHPNSTLADLYDRLTMPADLRAAHRQLDAAVLAAYGLPGGASHNEILAALFSRYGELAEAGQLPLQPNRRRRRARRVGG